MTMGHNDFIKMVMRIPYTFPNYRNVKTILISGNQIVLYFIKIYYIYKINLVMNETIHNIKLFYKYNDHHDDDSSSCDRGGDGGEDVGMTWW